MIDFGKINIGDIFKNIGDSTFANIQGLLNIPSDIGKGVGSFLAGQGPLGEQLAKINPFNPSSWGNLNPGLAITESLGLPKAVFGPTPRDPVNELKAEGGLNFDYRNNLNSQLDEMINSGVDFGGIDPNLLRQMIGSTDEASLPLLADQLSSIKATGIQNQNITNAIAGLTKENPFMTSLQDIITTGLNGGNKFMNSLREATRSQGAADTEGAVLALKRSAPSGISPGYLSGVEGDIRSKGADSILKQLSSNDLDFYGKNLSAGVGIAPVGADLQKTAGLLESNRPVPMGGATPLRNDIASLLDTDISNEREQELTAKTEFQNLLSLVAGLISQTPSQLLTLRQGLNPGAFQADTPDSGGFLDMFGSSLAGGLGAAGGIKGVDKLFSLLG